jgi:hypothetical protein
LAIGVIGVGDRPHVTVALTGATAQLKLTAELKPFRDETVKIEVAPFPAIRVEFTGEVLRLKSFKIRE